MILRRFIQHVKDQNWFAVSLDVLVVVFGVYLGIYIGQAEEDRARQAAVHTSLSVLLDTLRKDVEQLDAVAESQSRAVQGYMAAAEALAPDDLNEKEFAKHDKYLGFTTRTYFPNPSAYRMMRDQGFLAKIQDKELALTIIDLFERNYQRLEMNSDTYEQVMSDYFTNVRNIYWDMDGQKLNTDDVKDIVRMRNACRKLAMHSRWYVGRLTKDIRPQVMEIDRKISTYLQAHQ